MSSFPQGDELLESYDDLLDGLELIWKCRLDLVTDVNSVFFGQTETELQQRLQKDREELEHWAVMMLAASFEGMLRTDARERIRRKTKDKLRKPLRAIDEKHGTRVRLEDIISLWDQYATVTATVKQDVRRVLHLRNWLAHGRHWVEKKSGIDPIPSAIHNILERYCQEAQTAVQDFPLA